jgi:hypothetical protein
MSFNGLRQGVLSSNTTILNNQAAPTLLIGLGDAFAYWILDYSVSKESHTRVGQLKITHNGSTAAINDAYVETGATGVVFSIDYAAGDLELLYTSTNGAGNGTFKCAWRKWN